MMRAEQPGPDQRPRETAAALRALDLGAAAPSAEVTASWCNGQALLPGEHVLGVGADLGERDRGAGAGTAFGVAHRAAFGIDRLAAVAEALVIGFGKGGGSSLPIKVSSHSLRSSNPPCGNDPMPIAEVATTA